jgi:hypothetical protein
VSVFLCVCMFMRVCVFECLCLIVYLYLCVCVRVLCVGDGRGGVKALQPQRLLRLLAQWFSDCDTRLCLIASETIRFTGKVHGI